MTTIGAETRINGRIEGDADVTVEGRVDGSIALTETLTVAPQGYVSGDIEAKMVVIEGFASGTVRASSVVHLTASAQVEGEIFANAVRVDPGARVRGRIEMDVAAAPPLPAKAQRFVRSSTPPKVEEPVQAQRVEQATESVVRTARAERTERPAPVERTERKPATNHRAQEPVARKPRPAPKPKKDDGLDFDPDDLTVKELREMLTDRGLALSGTKSELVQRLRTGE